MEKNLTPSHLAAKMGIATTLVRSWEDGSSQPESKQLQDLANYLGFALPITTAQKQLADREKTLPDTLLKELL